MASRGGPRSTASRQPVFGGPDGCSLFHCLVSGRRELGARASHHVIWRGSSWLHCRLSGGLRSDHRECRINCGLLWCSGSLLVGSIFRRGWIVCTNASAEGGQILLSELLVAWSQEPDERCIAHRAVFTLLCTEVFDVVSLFGEDVHQQSTLGGVIRDQLLGVGAE